MSNPYVAAFSEEQTTFLEAERATFARFLTRLFPEHRVERTPTHFIDSTGADFDTFRVHAVTGALPTELTSAPPTTCTYALRDGAVVVQVPHAHYWARFPYCTRADTCLVLSSLVAAIGVTAATFVWPAS